MEVEMQRCRMCNSEIESDPFIAREMMFGLREDFEYQECDSCGSVQIKTIPQDLGKYYSSDYYSMTSKSASSLKDLFRKSIVEIVLKLYFLKDGALRSILPAPMRGDLIALAAIGAKKDQSILDVGCGSNPNLLVTLSNIGFSNLTGSDPFINTEEKSLGKIRLLRREISEIEETYDIVLFNHSLEHVTDPRNDLSALCKVLKIGGVAVVRLPTPSSKAYELYGPDWVQLDAPRHLNLPSRKAMESMIDNAGLSVVRSYDDSTEFQFYGSELYKRNMALKDLGAKNIFNSEEIKKFKAWAKQMNSQQQGDQVVYILSHKVVP